MEMKNICGKIPLELHAKVREEIDQSGISIPEFLQRVIEEHFIGKGVDTMAARTIAVQVSEELFTRFKAAVAWKGCKQKDFLIRIITDAIEAVEAEQKNRMEKASGTEADAAEPLEPEAEAAETEPENEVEAEVPEGTAMEIQDEEWLEAEGEEPEAEASDAEEPETEEALGA